MLIHLFRHGDAPFNTSCGERSLSVEGKIETHQIVEQHFDTLSQLQLIVCSPVLRARQTLEILTESLNYSGQLLFEDVLRSEGSVSRVEHCVDALVNSLKVENLLLLSHQPLIGQILEYLTDESGLAWSMNTSSLASLEMMTFGRGCAELRELANP